MQALIWAHDIGKFEEEVSCRSHCRNRSLSPLLPVLSPTLCRFEVPQKRYELLYEALQGGVEKMVDIIFFLLKFFMRDWKRIC